MTTFVANYVQVVDEVNLMHIKDIIMSVLALALPKIGI